jgi:excisionase family DNA binding protein
VNDQPESPFMTAEDIAAYPIIPVTTIYKLAREGKLPAVRIGKHWRFRIETGEQLSTVGQGQDPAPKF